MQTATKVLRRIGTGKVSVSTRQNFDMEEVMKSIFYAAVDSVKASEIVTKNKLMKLYNANNREIIEINVGMKMKKFDVTGKRIHLGESFIKE